MKPKRKNQSKPRCKTCAVNLAALSDASSQLAEAKRMRDEAVQQMVRQNACLTSWRERSLELHNDCFYLGKACELNMAEYLKATSALKEELLATASLREEIAGLKRDYKAQIERTYAENEKDRQVNVDAYNKLWNEYHTTVAMLEQELEHSDADRRQQARDLEAADVVIREQQAKLAIYAPFRVKSSLLQGDHV